METRIHGTYRKPEPITWWPEAQLLFRILIQGHRPDEFNSLWQRQLEWTYPNTHMDERSVGHFAQSFPKIHLLNDLVGMAEVFWDGGTRILADFYFRAIGRRRFGRMLKSTTPGRLNPRHFYMLYHAREVGCISPSPTASDCRDGLLEAIRQVGTEATELGCYADTSVEEELVRHLDVVALFRRNRT